MGPHAHPLLGPLLPPREETITTVVKSPRGRRRSPSKSPSRSPSRRSASPSRPGLLAAESPPLPGPGAGPGWKPTVPALFVTEAEAQPATLPGGVRPQSQWVEVEETIEVCVKKTGPQEGDPNSNNSNNKLLAPGPAVVYGSSQPLVLCVDAEGSVQGATPGTGVPAPEMDTPLEEESDREGEGENWDTSRPWSWDSKILKRDGCVLTLADLEDYVPQAGETFGRHGAEPCACDDPPCEVAVVQHEITEPTVGQPVLLNLGHPLGSAFRPGPRDHWAQGISPVGPQAPRCFHSGQASFKTEVSTQVVGFGAVGETVTVHIAPGRDSDPCPSRPGL